MEREAPAPQTPRGPADSQLRIVVSDDLRRSRLTVFFRLLLALPHLVWFTLWSLLMVLVAVVNWLAVLLTTRPIATGLIRRYLRYYAHVGSYLYLGANPFPGFTGAAGGYPIELELPEPERQSRLKALFRLVLAVPALLLAMTFVSASVWYETDGTSQVTGVSFGVLVAVGVLGWFVSLARGRMAQGLRDLIAYGIGYITQLLGYLLLLTDRYPDSDPLRPRYGRLAPLHPVRVRVADDLRRSRLTVFFRLLLALPHMVWLALWAIAVAVVVIVNWFVTLFAGRPAHGLHGFVSRYVRYAAHVTAYLTIVANPFPGFTGEPGSYPVDAQLPPPARQRRWVTGFRLVLGIPAFVIASVIGNLLSWVALFCWFTGVFTGRVPPGLRNLGAFVIRYTTQTYAYLLLLTDRYPFAGPSLEELPGAEPAPQPA